MCETLSGPNSEGQSKQVGLSIIWIVNKLFSLYNDSQVPLCIASSNRMLLSKRFPSFAPYFLTYFSTLISTYHSPALSLNSSTVLLRGLIHEDTHLHLYCFYISAFPFTMLYFHMSFSFSACLGVAVPNSVKHYLSISLKCFVVLCVKDGI